MVDRVVEPEKELTEEERAKEKVEDMGQAIADVMMDYSAALKTISKSGLSRAVFDKALRHTKQLYWLMVGEIPNIYREDMKRDLEAIVVSAVTPPPAADENTGS